MVHQLYEGGVCLADWQTGPAAPHVPAENSHKDCEGKQMLNIKMATWIKKWLRVEMLILPLHKKGEKTTVLVSESDSYSVLLAAKSSLLLKRLAENSKRAWDLLQWIKETS